MKAFVFVMLFVFFEGFNLKENFNHKYYYSLTQITVNTENSILQVSSKLFIDDLELELSKMGNKKVDLSLKSNDSVNQRLLVRYFDKCFGLTLNQKPLKLNWLGFEVEQDLVWVYMESIIKVKKFRELKVKNSLLYANFPEQVNLVQLSWNKSAYSGKLNYPVSELLLR